MEQPPQLQVEELAIQQGNQGGRWKSMTFYVFLVCYCVWLGCIEILTACLCQGGSNVLWLGLRMLRVVSLWLFLACLF